MTTFTRQRLRTALLFASLPFITLQAAYAASGCATQNGPAPRYSQQISQMYGYPRGSASR